MTTTLKAVHDKLLEERPEDAVHVASECPFCIAVAEVASATLDGGNVPDKTYTQEEQDALLAQVADLKTKVAELSKVSEESATDAKIAAATAELEAQVTDLQSKLDAAVLETQAAKDEHTALVASLAEEKAAADAAAVFAARKEERVTQVKEVASFPDEYLEANADRFAAMSDEDFAQALADWQLIAAKTGAASTSIPAATAMTAAHTTTDAPSVLNEVLNLRFQGVDVRSVH